ncbi:MAG: hypothetical protein ACK45H_07080 [Bacteroidota bacterium]
MNRTVIFIFAILLISSAAKTQSYEKPLKLNEGSKNAPLNEWYTYDGKTKYYKGSGDHVHETAFVVLYEIDGDWHLHDSTAVRENDRYTTMEIESKTMDVYIWDLSNKTSLFLIGNDNDDRAMIYVKPTK